MSNFYIENPIEIENGGMFISNGTGSHPKRTIGSFELIFVYCGQLAIREGDKDYLLKEGDTLLLHPNVEHGGLIPYPRNLKFYWVHFHLNRYSKATGSHTVIDLIKMGQVSDVSKIVHLFHLLLREQELGLDKITLNLILLLIIREVSVKSSTEQHAKPVSLAYRAQSYIRCFYRDPITPSIIARKLQCNVDYLGRVFKQTFDLTLSESIQYQKINAAKRDLLELNQPIEELALALGFSDAGYFRRMFVKHMGMTPTAYRKTYTINHLNSE